MHHLQVKSLSIPAKISRSKFYDNILKFQEFEDNTQTWRYCIHTPSHGCHADKMHKTTY